MIVDTETLLNSVLSECSDPRRKLSKMAKDGEIIRLKKGLYETDPTTSSFEVANEILRPSYISFEYALSWYGVIPEYVVSVTSATCGKHKSAMFHNQLGTFRYMNVPANVFEIGVIEWEAGDKKVRIASKEKAVCDKLFKICPMRSLDDIEALMFEDLRFDDDEILSMDLDLI